jgi:hypothetical protein
MANPRTGLPFVVWISPKAGSPHDVRVKVSRGPKVHSSELISVAIRPDVHVVGGSLSAHELEADPLMVTIASGASLRHWDESRIAF